MKPRSMKRRSPERRRNELVGDPHHHRGMRVRRRGHRGVGDPQETGQDGLRVRLRRLFGMFRLLRVRFGKERSPA